jgi:hypothetical protein
MARKPTSKDLVAMAHELVDSLAHDNAILDKCNNDLAKTNVRSRLTRNIFRALLDEVVRTDDVGSSSAASSAAAAAAAAAAQSKRKSSANYHKLATILSHMLRRADVLASIAKTKVLLLFAALLPRRC